uniref:C2 domain-containing protein n=1 Tax=Romanomermis culicivorax TaxID=13658 RepID=A0A915HN48_ROMCU
MDNEGADCEEIDAKLVHETLQLLSNVTYIRVIIDRINWQIAPKFVLDEAKYIKTPRNRGQIFLTYQIPALQKASPRGSSKIFKVVAKSASEEGIIFNEKHVSLCKITSAIIDNWATNSCEIKCFYCPSRKRSPILFARCAIPMSKILVLPFSFDSSKVQLDMVSDVSSSRGYLKICMQLGSRIQHFLERVEPMRNPTTSVSPLTFLDPTTVRSPRKPDERHYRLLSAETLPGQYVVERHDKDQYSANGVYTKAPALHRPAADNATDLSPVSSHRRPAYFDDDHFSTRFSRRKLLNGRNDEAEHDRNSENDRFGGRNGEFDTSPNHERIGFSDKNGYLHRSQPTSPTSHHNFNAKTCQFSPSKRKHTVAERLKLSVGESLHARANEFNRADNRQLDFPPVSNGYWLQVTIHQAKHLPFIKSKKTGQMRKPNCFVTYRNNEKILASNVVSNSLNPNWRWTTQLFVPSDRKNVVFKIWHKLAMDVTDNKSKVIGFVALELPTAGPYSSVTNWYDIMDLARSSSGQLQ